VGGKLAIAPAIVIRPAGNKENEITANIGKDTLSLYNIGGV
jgi:hypothetical protein